MKGILRRGLIHRARRIWSRDFLPVELRPIHIGIMSNRLPRSCPLLESRSFCFVRSVRQRYDAGAPAMAATLMLDPELQLLDNYNLFARFFSSLSSPLEANSASSSRQTRRVPLTIRRERDLESAGYKLDWRSVMVESNSEEVMGYSVRRLYAVQRSFSVLDIWTTLKLFNESNRTHRNSYFASV